MRIAFGLALLGAACIYACGSSNSSSPGGSGGADGKAGGNASAGKGSQSEAGAGNDSGGGEAGQAGEGGAPTVVVVSSAKPRAAGGLVAGGVIAHSKHFTGVFSLGAGPGGNGLLTSSKSQLRGGVLGASQK